MFRKINFAQLTWIQAVGIIAYSKTGLGYYVDGLYQNGNGRRAVFAHRGSGLLTLSDCLLLTSGHYEWVNSCVNNLARHESHMHLIVCRSYPWEDKLETMNSRCLVLNPFSWSCVHVWTKFYPDLFQYSDKIGFWNRSGWLYSLSWRISCLFWCR